MTNLIASFFRLICTSRLVILRGILALGHACGLSLSFELKWKNYIDYDANHNEIITLRRISSFSDSMQLVHDVKPERSTENEKASAFLFLQTLIEKVQCVAHRSTRTTTKRWKECLLILFQEQRSWTFLCCSDICELWEALFNLCGYGTLLSFHVSKPSHLRSCSVLRQFRMSIRYRRLQTMSCTCSDW